MKVEDEAVTEPIETKQEETGEENKVVEPDQEDTNGDIQQEVKEAIKEDIKGPTIEEVKSDQLLSKVPGEDEKNKTEKKEEPKQIPEEKAELGPIENSQVVNSFKNTQIKANDDGSQLPLYVDYLTVYNQEKKEKLYSIANDAVSSVKLQSCEVDVLSNLERCKDQEGNENKLKPIESEKLGQKWFVLVNEQGTVIMCKLNRLKQWKER